MNSLRDRMKSAREAAGLSQEKLAELARCGQSTIASVENGRNKGATPLVMVAHILGVEPLWLVEGMGPRRRGSETPEQTDEEIQIPPVIAPDDTSPGLYAVENRTVSRPPLTDTECIGLDGFRIASEEVKNDILKHCLLALHQHGQRDGERRSKQA